MEAKFDRSYHESKQRRLSEDTKRFNEAKNKSVHRWPFAKGEDIAVGAPLLLDRLNRSMKSGLDSWARMMVRCPFFDRVKLKVKNNSQVMYCYRLLLQRGVIKDEGMVRTMAMRMTLCPQSPSLEIRLGQLEAGAKMAMDKDAVKYTQRWQRIRGLGEMALLELQQLAAPFVQRAKPRQRFGSKVVLEHKDHYGDGPGHWSCNDGDMVFLQCAADTVDLIAEACQCFPGFEDFVSNLKTATGAEKCSASRKRLARAATKVSRAYLDWSLVTDLVRASLIYSTLERLVAALRVLINTECVEILRVKNRLSDDYKADERGGYRDVLINLRTPGSLHVCELQLNLVELYELKSDKGHKHYVSYRDAMME